MCATKTASPLEEVSFMPADRRVSLSNLGQICDVFDSAAKILRVDAMRPNEEKIPPRFTSSRLAQLCGIDRKRLNYLAGRGDLPKGDVEGRTRMFSLAESQEWVRAMPEFKPRDPKAPGAILSIAMLKGGATKTTSTISFAQGLTLLGRKVLVIDLDPQASLSELAGVFVSSSITEDDTVLPYIQDPDNFDMKSVVRPTYWPGMDIIPAHPGLFESEFLLPGQLMQDSRYRFFEILKRGLDPLRDEYDYIFMDTAPSLSYLNINAFMAADSLIMPIVPEALDVFSSLTFWTLLREFAGPIEEHFHFKKEYDFVSIILTKVNNAKAGTSVVRDWIRATYLNWVSPIEIPLSAAITNSQVLIGNIFDFNSNEVNAQSMARIREPIFEYCKWIDRAYTDKWHRVAAQAHAAQEHEKAEV